MPVSDTAVARCWIHCIEDERSGRKSHCRGLKDAADSRVHRVHTHRQLLAASLKSPSLCERSEDQLGPLDMYEVILVSAQDVFVVRGVPFLDTAADKAIIPLAVLLSRLNCFPSSEIFFTS